jgi:prevent-host-death family protein
MRFVNVRELKSNTSEILKFAAGEEIIVTKRGKPVAVITAYDGADLERTAVRREQGRVNEAGAGYGGAADEPPPPRALREGSRAFSNPLKAVFWDCPSLADRETLRRQVEEARKTESADAFRWLLTRMLERGRAVDAMKLFSLAEIREGMPKLRLTEYARRKWTRLLQVYGHA